MSDDLSKQAAALAPDRLLAYFVALAETTDLAMTLTLHVHGQAVSGMLSGSVAYIDGIGELFRNAAPDPDTAQSWRQSFRDAATTGRGKLDTLTTEHTFAITAQTQGHIHLRDALVTLPSGDTLLLGWWRGRLSSVDGWAFGA